MRQFRLILSSAAFLGVFSAPLFAQSGNFDKPAPRVTQAVDNAQLAVLATEVHPLVKRSVDLGPVDGALALDRMTLMLKRSPAQQRALDKLTTEQQDKSSPNYHRWLTPAEFGARFGPAQSDIDQVTAWLQSQGFKIDKVANGRQFVEFSGNAAQVAQAFHTSIHNYSLNGEAHIANSTTLAMPAALAPVVVGVRSLHDFRKKPLYSKVSATSVKLAGAGDAQPGITFKDGSHGMGPADFAVIYNSQPLLTASPSVNGAGKTIAVVGRSNINPATLANFRKIFGLGAGSATVVLNGPDPGILSQIGVPCPPSGGCPERDEALLDNEWSAAVAPGATVKFVVSQTTNQADGVDLSEQYIIDNNIGDIMTESFGSCEANNSQALSDQNAALTQQGAAEGITYMVSSGDSGAALCGDPNSGAATGTDTIPSVNILASSQFTVAVGGTLFNEGCTIGADGQTLTCANDPQFWNATSAPGNSATPFLSAKSYIPENAWNESCPNLTTGSVTGCGGGANLFATGGGASQFVAKPSWQTLAISGIPAADHRYLPDVSLTAAGHDFYVVCLDDADCVPDSSNNFSLHGIAGTSASSPSFAGVMALVDQNNGRQGMAAQVLYTLAAGETFANCDGSNQTVAPASTCIFNDTTAGSNAVPGEAGYGTTGASFQAGVGYDQATGLGSVNVQNLVNAWPAAERKATTTTLASPVPASAAQGTSVALSATVSGTPGTPTGSVIFTDSNDETIGTATLSGGVATLNTTTAPVGSYMVKASYQGDGTFASSISLAVPLTVTAPAKIATTTSISAVGATSSQGGAVALTATVAGTGGSPTGTVTFTANTTANTFSVLGTATLAGGVATLNTTTLPLGTFAATAGYLGDVNFSPSSATTPVTLNVMGFTLAANPGSVTLPSAGATTGNSATVTLTPAGGFSGVVALSCSIASSAALPPTCAVNPASVTVNGPVTATVTFGSVAGQAKPAGTQRASGTNEGWLAAGGIAFAGVLFFGFPRRRNWGAMLGLLLFAVMAGGIGCGSGSPPVTKTPGTTAGTYTATVIGSNGAQNATATITVVVP